MFKTFLKNKQGQNTAEYALLIALVVAGIIAMQQYAQRALQARVRDASVYMASSTNKIGTSAQYEPYYQQSNYTVDRNSEETKKLDLNKVVMNALTNRSRTGVQNTSYNSTLATPSNAAMPQGL